MRGQAGAALVIALVVMLVMGVLVAAVLAYSTTSSGSIRNYRNQRDARYAGDAALKAAINYVATNPVLARDGTLGLNDPACITTQNVVLEGTTKTVKVSCKADDNGGSGKPAEVGLTPPESLLLLSDRSAEPGPYNARPCEGWWDSFTGFFTQNNTSTVDASKGLIPEVGAWFRPTSGLGTLGASCSTVSRTPGNFKVQGDLAVKSSVRVDMGNLTIVGGSNSGKAYAGESAACPTYCTGLNSNRSGFDPSGPLAYLNGTSRVSDPGRTNPAAGQTSALGNIAAPFLPVGFNADGTPSGTLTTRTSAYLYDPATSTATTTTSTCPANSTTIVFLPGWYKSAKVLNDYTKSAACKDATFWFAPDPGADGKLLTADDKTGTFYFDFRTSFTGSAASCNGVADSTSRWCIGGSSDQNSRVVVGTPKGWTPQGTFVPAPGGVDTRTRINVVVGTAGTVDQDLSQKWFNTSAYSSSNQVAAKAAAIDGNVAVYHANVCVFVCFSSDRAIRVRDFTPKVTGPPIDETGAPKGRVYVEVAYGVEHAANANPAQAVIEAVSPASGRKACGTYTLYGNTSASAPYNNKANADYSGSGALPATYKFTADQAKQLADACGTVDLLNGLEIKVQVTGNGTNQPRVDWFFDGARMSYDAFPGANFPNPVGTGTTSSDVAAKSDCDPTKAGGQLVFGGASSVYVADGSLEVCAGPYPVGSGDSVENHQSIGVWALPAVAEVSPTGTVARGGDTASLGNTGGIAEIDKNPMTINYDACNFFCGDRNAWADVQMNGYTPPAGYKIQRITARIGYNPKNSNCTGLFGCPGASPTFETDCGDVGFPKHSDQRMQIADFTDKMVMYDDGSTGNASKNCLGVATGGTSLPQRNVRWHARADCVAGICGGPYSDELDGIKYQVTLAPTGTSARLLPQTGCAVAHPQYNAGASQPDCALIKANTLDVNDNWSAPWATKEGQWRGRVSVRGTIYAPSGAVEVDDTDVAYPLATRGAILRHLRITGFAPRNLYDGVAIDNTVDRTPQAREATFVACIQVATSATQPCGSGDKVLSRARVRFEIDSTETDPVKRAKIPSVQWYSEDR